MISQADPAPDSPDLLKSAWYTEEAKDALRRADRAEAILLALRGIPADPRPDDVGTYSGAFDALYLAAASVAFQANIPIDSSMFWGPNGRYLVTSDFTPDSRNFIDQAVELWDSQTGQVIAELLPAVGDHDYTNVNQFSGFSGPFSPDGTMIAISVSPEDYGGEPMSGQVNVHSTSTGQRIISVAGDMFQGWSQSGNSFIVSSRVGDEAWVYDTATWQVSARIPSGTFPGGTQYSYIAGSDDAFYAVHESYNYSPEGLPGPSEVFLFRVDRTGARQVADLSALGGIARISGFHSFGVNRHQPYLALRIYGGDLVILGLDGTVRARIPHVANSSYVEFVRDGTAIIVADQSVRADWDIENVRVFDLDGQSLEPDIRELVPLTDNVMSPRGLWITYALNSRRADPDAWPTGVALHDMIWEAIPPELKALISAERIERP